MITGANGMFKKKSVGLVLLISLLSSQSYAFTLNDISKSVSDMFSGGERKHHYHSTQKSEESNYDTSPQTSERNSSFDGKNDIVIGFSPEGSAQTAILDFINSAKSQIRLSAYSFTSPAIVHALINAKRRGVDIKLVIDYKANTNKTSQYAIRMLKAEDIQVRTNDHYAIHHDKFIIVDNESVETGSFNYSNSANTRNSENAIVLYHMPQVAAPYLEHWESRWKEGNDA